MGFFWGNGIQGEPGYSPGGLPGVSVDPGWQTPQQKIQEKKQGKQLCVIENQPFQMFIYVFFQELILLGVINAGTHRFVLEAAGSEHGILQSTMK